MRQDQQSGNNDNSLDFLWLIVGMVIVAALVWYFGKNYIAGFIYQVRYYEIVAVDFTMRGWVKLVQLSRLPLPVPKMQTLMELTTYIKAGPGEARVNNLVNLSMVVGSYIRYPIILLLALLSIVVYRSNLIAKFQHVFSMQLLRKEEQRVWPQIVPVAKLNLVPEDLDKGPWAMATAPMDFCKKNKLLKKEADKDGKPMVSLNIGAAHRVFALQLGPLFTAVEKLPIHAQALFAIFAARANRDREGADKLLIQLSASTGTGKLDFTGTQELLVKNAGSKLVGHVVSRHAYVLTMMASMLELARTDGVLASAEFIWLKPLDRKLWYMLNSVGRQTSVAEISGAFSHWLAERRLGRPMQVPMVDQAVSALETLLKEIIYEPEDV